MSDRVHENSDCRYHARPDMTAYTQENLFQLASRWIPSLKKGQPIRVHTNTGDFFKVDYGGILLLDNRPYLIRQCAREGRFGLDEEVKHWVRHAIDLEENAHCFIKLVFYEKFTARIGSIEFDCFRSPRKEARILHLVRNHRHFMHGLAVTDGEGNIVRILKVIHGKPLPRFIEGLEENHQSYFFERFPDILRHFIQSVAAIGFLHEHGEKHGDIRRDHIIVDAETGRYRWIDYDFNYRHRENIFGYDLFGLGNILVYLVGQGDILTTEMKKQGHPALAKLDDSDVNIVFHNRVANLRKVFPYVPERLNRVLLHFSRGANRFYEHTNQLIEDLEECESLLRGGDE